MTRLRKSLCCLVNVMLLTNVAAAGDWPHWRGPARNGIVEEASGFRDGTWSLEEKWRVETGAGGAAPIAVNDRVFVFGWEDDKEVLRCLNANDGSKVWEQSYAAPKHSRLATGEQGLYSGPSGSPSFNLATGLIFTLGADGDLTAWNSREQGQRVWHVNLITEFQVPQRPKVARVSVRDYGYTSAPLVIGETVIVEVGSPQCLLVAFDSRTGKQVWKSEAKGAAGHSGGPVPIELDKVACVANFGWHGLHVIRVEGEAAGKTVCEIPWQTNYANNVAGPTVVDKSVILTSEYNQARIARFELALDQPPVMTWEAAESSRVCSPVLLNDRVCWAWKQLRCVDFATGKVHRNEGETGDAGSMIVTSDRRIVLWSGQGDLALYEPPTSEGTSWKQLAKVPTLGTSDAWPHLVFSNGRYFCKDRLGRLVCLQVK